MTSDRPIRVGGIDYLNSQPLLWGLDRDGRPPLRLEHHRPSRLAALLAAGELDVALVPVAAWSERADYRVVPGLSISSHGPVRSIRLYHRRRLEDVRSVALDTSSRTSTLLTRLLFRERWRGDPRFETVPPALLRATLESPDSTTGAPWDAALLIGDDALSCGRFPGWDDTDLGVAWTSWTGLPFVYAFWVTRDRSGAGDPFPGLVDRLHRAALEGSARIDEIVRAARLPLGMTEADARDYLTRVIGFDLGPEKLEGLREFYGRVQRAGLFDPAPLRFLESEVPAAR